GRGQVFRRDPARGHTASQLLAQRVRNARRARLDVVAQLNADEEAHGNRAVVPCPLSVVGYSLFVMRSSSCTRQRTTNNGQRTTDKVQRTTPPHFSARLTMSSAVCVA